VPSLISGLSREKKETFHLNKEELSLAWKSAGEKKLGKREGKIAFTESSETLK